LNTATSGGPDIFGNTSSGSGATTSKGFNLIGNNKDANLTAATTDQIGTVSAPIDPLLGPLQENGGPTKTHALLANSKAIDKGDSSGSSADQRGFTRPVFNPAIARPGDGSDIGAYEVQADQLAGCSEINLVVNNNADSGTGSLRSVIGNACPGSTITFAGNVRGTITTSSELLIDKGLTIKGPGADLLSVQRSTAGGTASFRIFTITGTFNAAISGLTVSNGLSSGSGGGINSNATLRLTNVAVTGNKAQNGGGLYNSGTMTLVGATLSGNSMSTAIVPGSGGGIFNFGAPLTLINSTLSGNTAIGPGGNNDSGGGIFSNVGTVSLISCTITNNSGDIGGGVRVANGGTLIARNTIIALNTTTTTGPDVNGPLTSQGFNLIGSSSGASIAASTSGPDQIGITAAELNLATLQYNAGPTQTHALLANSRAIDKGHSSSTTTDQRGLSRPADLPNIPHASGGDGSDIGAFEVQPPTPALLAQISTRLKVGTGDNALFGGFIITGNQPKRVIVRAVGPTVPVAGNLQNPTLNLYTGQTLLTSNDNWVDAPNKQEIIDSGVAPKSDFESAILTSLAPGAYTGIVRGVSDTTGVALVEVYDLGQTSDSKLAQISTRGFVQTGDNAMFGGFFVLNGPQKVIIRAIGPSTGLSGALQDPTLELHDGNGALITANDNWPDSPDKQAIIDSTVPPKNDFESAVVRTLSPGPYSAIVRGTSDSTGIALVEVYALN
jgi:hypothetical protein